MDASVGAMASDVVTASALAASAVDEIVNALWDELTSEGRTAGSYGQLLKDNLNAAITSRMATFSLPANFAALAIDVNGRVDISKWLGATVNALIAGRVDANTQALAVAVITAAAFAVDAIDAAAIKADAGQELADRFLERAISGGSDSGRKVKSAFRRIRNRNAISGATLTTYEEDDTTPDHTATVTTAAGNPVTEVDPA
jgi:hypothetical protein